MSQSAVWRIENGEPRRKITVDELLAFAKVFDRSVDDLLQTPTKEYPEDTVKEYAEAWLREEEKVWRQTLDAAVKFGDVVAMLAAYPGAVPRFPAMLEGLLEVDHRSVVKSQVDRRLKELPVRVSHERRTTSHLSDTAPLIRYWRRIGLSMEDMVKEAEHLGVDGTLGGSLRAELRARARVRPPSSFGEQPMPATPPESSDS